MSREEVFQWLCNGKEEAESVSHKDIAVELLRGMWKQLRLEKSSASEPVRNKPQAVSLS